MAKRSDSVYHSSDPFALVPPDNWPMYGRTLNRQGHNPNSSVTDSPTATWTFSTNDSNRSSPVVGDGAVFIGSEDNYIYAVEREDGSERWSYETAGWVTGSGAVKNGVLYIGSSVWSYSIGAETSASPALAGGEVYIAGDDGNVYAFDAADGSNLWTLSLTDVELRIQPIIFGGVLYQALPITDDQGFYAIE